MPRGRYLYTPVRTMFIPVGTPLMGKTTWIERNIPSSVAIISRDGIRYAISRKVSLGIGSFYETITDGKIEEEIEDLWWKAIIWNMKRAVPIVVDTTNLTFRGRHKLCNTAKQYHYHTVIVAFSDRLSLGECINKDISIMYQNAINLYKNAIKIKHEKDYLQFIKHLGISSNLCQTLLLRNFKRFKRTNIFINVKVLTGMLKRMYRDYPTRAYTPNDFQKIIITFTSHPCLSPRCFKVPYYKAIAQRPNKPTMEGREW